MCLFFFMKKQLIISVLEHEISSALKHYKNSLKPNNWIENFHAKTIWIETSYENFRDQAAAQSLSRTLTLCDPGDCSLPGSSVHGVPQAKRLEWVAVPSSRASSWPRDQTWVPCIAGSSLLLSHQRSPQVS